MRSVVRRLVEHQEVGLHHEQAGEVGAHDPTAGILAGGFMEVGFLVAETGENFLRLRFELIAVDEGELVLGVRVVRVTVGAGRLVLAHRAEDVDHLRVDAHGDFENRLVARVAGFLREVTGDRVFIALDRAFIRIVLAEDHAEKGRFARAVRTDESDAFAPVDGHLGLTEQGASAEGLGELVNAEHGGDVGRRASGAKFQNVAVAARGRPCERRPVAFEVGTNTAVGEPPTSRPATGRRSHERLISFLSSPNTAKRSGC
jgi:hypothetical protein